jgi:hypothetical protein
LEGPEKGDVMPIEARDERPPDPVEEDQVPEAPDEGSPGHHPDEDDDRGEDVESEHSFPASDPPSNYGAGVGVGRPLLGDRERLDGTRRGGELTRRVPFQLTAAGVLDLSAVRVHPHDPEQPRSVREIGAYAKGGRRPFRRRGSTGSR